jgi:hypothetical protein
MDWLDEEGDGRGEMLRLELEMFRRGCPGDLHVRVSRLAASADPDWLACAPLMAALVAGAWGPAAGAFSRSVSAGDEMGWPEAVAALRERFPELVVPYGYTIFQARFPGRWFRAGGPARERTLWGADMVVQRTLNWYDEMPDSRELWLSIGCPWSDHEEDFLCCVPSGREFGAVTRIGDDEHPTWGTAAHLWRCPSHLEYLRSLAR